MPGSFDFGISGCAEQQNQQPFSLVKLVNYCRQFKSESSTTTCLPASILKIAQKYEIIYCTMNSDIVSAELLNHEEPLLLSAVLIVEILSTNMIYKQPKSWLFL